MAMPAQGETFVLKGASESDIQVIQDLLDSYQGKPWFDPSFGPGKAVALESGDSSLGIEIDLSCEGVIKMKSTCEGDAKRTAIIFYEKEDRRDLLTQLVLMVSGNRIADADFADLMPVLEKGCKFKCFEADRDYLSQQIVAGIKDEIRSTGAKRVELIIQFCDPDPLGWRDFDPKMDDVEITDIVSQWVSTDEDADKGLIAVFCANADER